MTVYFLTAIVYNTREMAKRVAKLGLKKTRYQVYLNDDVHNALQRYIKDNFVPGTRVVTATIRNALVYFLKGKGYLK